MAVVLCVYKIKLLVSLAIKVQSRPPASLASVAQSLPQTTECNLKHIQNCSF